MGESTSMKFYAKKISFKEILGPTPQAQLVPAVGSTVFIDPSVLASMSDAWQNELDINPNFVRNIAGFDSFEVMRCLKIAMNYSNNDAANNHDLVRLADFARLIGSSCLISKISSALLQSNIFLAKKFVISHSLGQGFESIIDTLLLQTSPSDTDKLLADLEFRCLPNLFLDRVYKIR
ncbi:unnamed protein product [Caenorhabditis angaria]|uniref:Uncharacterized protein n=1 Tax=Caenorhabditis angaria TaxID=860376 RepID=A0A9P1I468_9PELO|nr:unnamed protein product [Caenorhabditis angaria]